jgi:enoyl-CoA hydratase
MWIPVRQYNDQSFPSIFAPMDHELVRSHAPHFTRLTLNRPQKANALSATLVEALLDAVEYAYTDGTRLLVLDGAGDNFCAGFDFSGYLEAGEGDLALRFIRIEHLLQQLYYAPFVTAAFAHGKNFGAGVDLICSCGLRVAAPGSTFRMPGLRFGIVLGTQRLAQRIGTDGAREVLMTSKTLDAEHALRLKLISDVAAQSEWPAMTAAALKDSTVLQAGALARLHEQTVTDSRAADMAALALSASVPGLKERIRMFRETKS